MATVTIEVRFCVQEQNYDQYRKVLKNSGTSEPFRLEAQSSQPPFQFLWHL